MLITVIVESARGARITTLCDGYPRYAEHYRKTITSSAYKTRYIFNPSKVANYTGKPPSCVVNDADCMRFYASSWSAESSQVSKGQNRGILGITSGWGIDVAVPSAFKAVPGCQTRPSEMPADADVGCGKFCTVVASSAQLLYFPVTTVGDLCNGSASTITATPTVPGKPNTAVLNGTTFTSGLVYIMFPRVFVTSQGIPSGGVCGSTTRTNVLISMQSQELSSVGVKCRSPAWNTYPFNYADLNRPHPPVSVYQNHIYGYCEFSELNPMHEHLNLPLPYEQNGYNPIISIPAYITQIDPLWSTCGVHYQGSLDPPAVLMPVNALVGVTTAASLPGVALPLATPGSYPAPPAVESTGQARTLGPNSQEDQVSNAKTSMIVHIGSTEITAVVRPDFTAIFGSQTLTPGAIATISGVPISVGKDGLLLDGEKLTIPTVAPSIPGSTRVSNSRAGPNPSGKGTHNIEAAAATSSSSAEAVLPRALGHLPLFALTLLISTLPALMS